MRINQYVYLLSIILLKKESAKQFNIFYNFFRLYN